MNEFIEWRTLDTYIASRSASAPPTSIASTKSLKDFRFPKKMRKILALAAVNVTNATIAPCLDSSLLLNRVRNILAHHEANESLSTDGAPLIARELERLWFDALRDRYRKWPFGDEEKAGFLHLAINLLRVNIGGDGQLIVDDLLALFGDLGARSFRELYVRGSLNKLNFRSVTFERCKFVDAEFNQCEFDSLTKFSHSKFDGRLVFDHCTDLQKVDFADIAGASPAAIDALRRAKVEGVDRRIRVEEVDTAIQYILGRFKSGPFGFKTRLADAVRSWAQKHSFLANIILEELLRARVLDTGRMSAGVAWKVADTGAALRFLDQGLATGPIKEAHERILHRVKSDI